ncbi:hypothetical protein BH160DRAFT_0603 [Burkholderia sp. H160]|nr:hypothetical protein BH160DRAFT_0603 [Burkholderia sp. H160]
MYIERFLRVSRAYLLASPVVAPRREFEGYSQLWLHTSARAAQAVQRNTSVAALWATSGHNVRGTSWPA